MLHLLVDTSTWLDLSERRDGQRWIVALRLLVHQQHVALLVPALVIEEFERNRERIESAMTSSVAQRFKLIKQDLEDYGRADTAPAAEMIADLARDVPLIGAMTLFEESNFIEEPRRLGEIVDAEKMFSDRIWHHRSLQHDYRLRDAGDEQELKRLRAVAEPGRKRVEGTYTEPGELGPYTDFELGMLNGKLSALRWVLGSEWDFLDT